MFIIGLSFIIQSCQKGIENDIPEINNSNHFVSIDKINEIVQSNKKFKKYIEQFKTKESTIKNTSSDSIYIEDYIEIKDSKNVTALYLVKLSNNSLVTLAADYRSHPIMSYSEFENEINIDSMPHNFLFWLYDEAMAIEFARNNNLEQTAEVKYEWYSISMQFEPPGGTPWECPNAYFEEKSPLLTTAWGQGSSYNNLCPYFGCDGNGHALTGCVATAMAQIMRYHEHPTDYNWSNMPDNYGTYDTQSLMSDAGVSVNMDYGCVSSGAYSWKVDDALEDDFNYSNATYGNFNHYTIKSNLQQNKPVYLRGKRISGNSYIGHAWVCDGYQAGHICVFDDYGNIIGEYDYLSFHMNWGWAPTYPNTWCGVNNFAAPNGYAYNYHKKMVYNITP
ncbi:MAG: C10 family peptidase [Clostridiales bacterium]|nr:C10 family peptidase [Clostridiales bacterium]